MGEWKTKRDFALFRSSGRSQSRDLSSGKKKSFNSEAARASVEVVEDCIASGRKMELDKEWHGFARHVEEISCEEAGGDTSNGLGPGQDQSSDVETSSSENQSDWPTGTVLKPFLLHPHISIDSQVKAF